MDQYISALFKIVREGNKVNSYKFALRRALARLAPHTAQQDPKISKQDLAAVFLEYYWPLEVKFHIRQGTDPDKDPIVMVRIRDLVRAGKIAEGETLRNFCRRTPSEYERLLGRVAREAFNDVIPRFHIVRGVPIKPAIFIFSGEVGKVGGTIELTGGSRRFLIDYGKVVDYVAVSGWVHFTEGFTSAPRLHDKIDGGDLKRGSITQWRGALLAIQNNECFYCESRDMASPEVDHVLPWTFDLEDRTWNLVLACRTCNNGKRDRLVDAGNLERLCARNEQIASGQINSDPRFLRHFEEWHSRDLSSHVRGLYDQAIADGFPHWNGQSYERMTTARQIWDNFCTAHRIAVDSVPLFESDGSGFVETKEIGQKVKRKVLVRHRDMEKLILRETDILIEDWSRKVHEYDGLIYIMHRRDSDGSLLPLYIGKAETLGRGDGNLSANLQRLHINKDKFARWGDNYAYHIGDLSAAVLTSHPLEKRNPKYTDWASRIFNNAPSDQPQLAFTVCLWAKAWKSSDVGIWPELSPTRLAFLEYLLIGVASAVFNESLLNYEGRHRRSKQAAIPGLAL